MALQTTGLEFFYLSVDFSENDKILLVEQELGYIACIAFIGTYLPQRMSFAVGERIGVCFLLADCPKDVRPIMYSK